MSVTEASASIQNAANPIEMACINTIRTLSMDAVQAANSGHPGTPMSMAPLAYCLWQEFLRHDPKHPHWPNRDRFVLSAGHASMLLYSVLHLAGVKRAGKNREILDVPAVPLDEIKRFRQLGSLCPGHPESHLTTGVETTTGPLGQGFANSVGMALAGRWLATRYNQPGFADVYNFNVYALGGDGCMMEGISSEAASLAGHLQLSNLCWIYDSNRITIEGGTPLAFSEDVGARFAAYGWNVIHVADANDLDMIRGSFRAFLQTADRPTLIVVTSHIGWGSPHKQDSHTAHGEALGEEEVKLTKRNYGWPEDAKFLVPDGVYEHFQAGVGKRGKELGVLGPAVISLCQFDLFFAECFAVGRVTVLLVRGAPADVARHNDERRAIGGLQERAEAAANHIQIVRVCNMDYIPAIRGEARAHIFGKSQRRSAFDRDPVA